MFALSSSKSSVFSHAIEEGGRVGGVGWVNSAARVNKWLTRAPLADARYCAHPLLLSRILSQSLVSVKIRAADTIKARAIKTKKGAVHLVMAGIEGTS